MPNQIQYSCYKIMTSGFCHASYMGVSYVMVLRLLNKKPPGKDYTLYEKNGSILSLSPESYERNVDCTKVESNKNRNNKPRSWKNNLTGIFKSKNKNRRNGIKKQKNPIMKEIESSIGGIFSKCSIL